MDSDVAARGLLIDVGDRTGRAIDSVSGDDTFMPAEHFADGIKPVARSVQNQVAGIVDPPYLVQLCEPACRLVVGKDPDTGTVRRRKVNQLPVKCAHECQHPPARQTEPPGIIRRCSAVKPLPSIAARSTICRSSVRSSGCVRSMTISTVGLVAGS